MRDGSRFRNECFPNEYYALILICPRPYRRVFGERVYMLPARRSQPRFANHQGFFDLVVQCFDHAINLQFGHSGVEG